MKMKRFLRAKERGIFPLFSFLVIKQKGAILEN
jgi:hypothetical protein